MLCGQNTVIECLILNVKASLHTEATVAVSD